jgi:hypothetical protein
VVLCWHAPEGSPDIGGTFPYTEAAYRAFVGRSESDGDAVATAAVPNWITGTRLTPLHILRIWTPEAERAGEVLDRALHTMVVAWVNEAAVASNSCVKWLGEVWRAVAASDERHGLLLGVPDERLRNKLYERATKLKFGSLSECQAQTWESLGEQAVRPALVALSALGMARELLIRGLGLEPRLLKLFISHAKIDGISLARALTRAAENVPALESFYDATDIPPGANWKKALQRAAESSVLIALRTDLYEGRPWCVREVAWADAAGAPIIVVEARADLFHSPSGLGVESCPWVRIPDGSLTRILYSAVRENLRPLLLRRGVKELVGAKWASSVQVLPRAPSWRSLDKALQQLSGAEDDPCFVVYPEPMLPATIQEALSRFLEVRRSGTRVLTYPEFVATYGQPAAGVQ